jgi:hypothetical protein
MGMLQAAGLDHVRGFNNLAWRLCLLLWVWLDGACRESARPDVSQTGAGGFAAFSLRVPDRGPPPGALGTGVERKSMR